MKFSSNVIEKCLDSNINIVEESRIEKIFSGAFPEDDYQIVCELGANRSDLNTRISFIVQKLIYNQFGNYVLQKALGSMQDSSLKHEVLMTIKTL